jgi:hypothetical protein
VDTYDEISGINLPRGKGGVSISWPCDITHIVKKIDEGNERIVAIEINADYNLYHLCIHANTQYMGGSRISKKHLKRLRRVEGGANIFGVFRLKNHDFTPKNPIFSNCGGRREHFWGISCEKSRFYAKKSYFFQI